MPNDDVFQRRMDDYDQRQAELDEMYAAFEAMDQAEYAEFMKMLDERDAQA